MRRCLALAKGQSSRICSLIFTPVIEPGGHGCGPYREGPLGARGGFPDVGDRWGIRACTGVGKPIELLNRAQDIVVGDLLSVVTGLHHGPDEECRDPVILFLIVLIPRHDQEAVVLLRPLDVSV